MPSCSNIGKRSQQKLISSKEIEKLRCAKLCVSWWEKKNSRTIRGSFPKIGDRENRQEELGKGQLQKNDLRRKRILDTIA